MPEVPYTYKGSTDMELEIEDRMRDQAGAGRGKQGGPTAKELADYERKQNIGIFTAGMKPPQDIDGGSVKKKVVKKAGGGMIESKRTKKFAGGGAMGSAQDMSKSLTELTGSLGTINQGLTGGGLGGGLSNLVGATQPIPMPDYDGSNTLRSGLNQLGLQGSGMKKGGVVKSSKTVAVKQAKPSMGSASKRGDGIAQRGKTRGKMC